MGIIEKLEAKLHILYDQNSINQQAVDSIQAILSQHKAECDQSARIKELEAQRDRLLQALDEASQAVWGYSDYRHEMGHMEIADKFNLMYGKHRELIKEIEESK